MNDTATQILDSAQAMMRDGGYYGFSFRQIADALEIKSASVHYHFPTKEALGTAVTARYTESFLAALGEPNRSNPVDHYVTLFQGALKSGGRACLCGILAGECGKLPDSVCEELQKFSDKNIEWLEAALHSEHPEWPRDRCHQAAMVLFAALEGAMMFAALHGKPDHLMAVADSLKTLIEMSA